MLLQKLGVNRWVRAPLFFGEKMWVAELAAFLAPLGYAGFLFEFDGRLRIGRLGELEVGHANVGFAPLSRPEFGFLLQP